MLGRAARRSRSRFTGARSFPPHRRALSAQAELPQQADVVVVGGGSIGSSVIYHLAKEHGVNAVLLESNKLTSGTTWHSAGLLWQLAGLLGSGDVDLHLSQYTKRLVQDTLPDEVGEWAGWTTTGSLFACSSEDRLIAHDRVRTMAKAIAGVESHVVSPEEAKEIHPLINSDDLVGCIHTPADGHIDPTAMVNAYIAGAKLHGAQIFEDVSIASIEQEGGRVSGLTTSCGHELRTPVIVNCTGAWARRIGAMAGVCVPSSHFTSTTVVRRSLLRFSRPIG